jgi:serine phosphatase RsbU (regulator of sigma subunit)
MADKGVEWLGVVSLLGSYGLGLVSLVWNRLRPASMEVRRKTQVIAWGTVTGLLPIMVFGTFIGFAHKSFTDIPFWIYVLVVTALFIIPLSFAYAVVKYRVLEIPVLVKRSARYLLVQRGFVLLTVALSLAAALTFAHFFSRLFRTRSDLALAAGLSAGVGLGVLLTWAGTETVKRGTQGIDRAFFRSAYDARQVLEHLAEKTRAATARQEVDALLREEINRALHPKFMAVYLETSEGWLSIHQPQGVPPGLEKISTRLPELSELARRGQAWEVPPEGKGGGRPLSVLASLEPECLVPMLGRNSRLVGVLVLGPRLSEEPYSREDKRLLTSVASQTGIAVESICLAEEMAERMDAERLAAQEMTIARQVQARLFPQKLPPLRTLEYAGACFQARQVGGDYYDFLDLGPGRLGFVLADVAGKGISGALLMANLQANLRSQYAVALEDLPGLLQSVNRLFYENTADSSYATLFFADYDDDARRFRYANCGHLPPLLLRSEGTVERLTATSTVLGLFEKWECLLTEVHMAPGDVLVVYTDGVTEASNAHEEEFGEDRLIESIRTSRQLQPSLLLDSLVAAVKAYSGVEQADDITLVVARAR